MCTGIQLRAGDGSVVFGRTLEFGIEIPADFTVIPRNLELTGTLPDGSAGMKYRSQYGVVGASGYGMTALLDGVNEVGLSAGLFYFPGFAEYASSEDLDTARALAPFEFTVWALTQFKTVDEVRAAVADIVIASTPLSEWGVVPPAHFIVTDSSGASLVIEPIGGKLVVHDNPVGAMSNSPTFDWHLTNLRNYLHVSTENVSPVDLAGFNLAPLGQGAGMLGLPGDSSPPSRFVRAVFFSKAAVPSDTGAESVLQAFHILNNFDIPVGSVRDEANGQTMNEFTMFTSVSDLAARRFYIKTYDNQQIKMIDLRACDLDADSILHIALEGEQPILDLTPAHAS